MKRQYWYVKICWNRMWEWSFYFPQAVSAYRDKILELQHAAPYEMMESWRIRNDDNYDRKPTFSEFVQYIIDEDSEGNALDMHWAPVYKFCSPCQVNNSLLILLFCFRKRAVFKAKYEKVFLSYFVGWIFNFSRQEFFYPKCNAKHWMF